MPGSTGKFVGYRRYQNNCDADNSEQSDPFGKAAHEIWFL
jgi:hypothetical protein